MAVACPLAIEPTLDRHSTFEYIFVHLLNLESPNPRGDSLVFGRVTNARVAIATLAFVSLPASAGLWWRVSRYQMCVRCATLASTCLLISNHR